jgi:hypothetical protein
MESQLAENNHYFSSLKFSQRASHAAPGINTRPREHERPKEYNYSKKLQPRPLGIRELYIR